MENPIVPNDLESIVPFLVPVDGETVGQRNRRERQEDLLQRLARGEREGVTRVAVGIPAPTFYGWRDQDTQFFAALVIARRRGQDARRALLADVTDLGVGLAKRRMQVVTEVAVERPELLKAAAEEDLTGEIDRGVATLLRAVQADRGVNGLDDRAQVNTQVNVAVGANGQPAPSAWAPSPDVDSFLAVDLGLTGDRDYHRDVAGGVFRRVVWILRHAFRDDVRRVILCVGKGGAKTVTISITLARVMQAILHAADSSHPRRGVLNLSASGGDQAEMAVFTDLRRWLTGPWFASHGTPSRETADHVEWTIPGGGVACAHSGNSRSEGVEGIDWLAAGADEVCRLPEEDNTRVLSAAGLVGPVEDTMVSRFGATYKLLVASWPEHQHDYLLSKSEKRPGQIEMARRTGIREDLTASFLGEPITWAGGAAEAARQAALREPPFADFASEVFISCDGTLVVHCPMWQVRPDADVTALRASHARDPVTFGARFGAHPSAEGRNPFLPDSRIVTERANPNRAHPMDDFGHFHDDFRGSPEFLYYAHIDASVKRDRSGIAVAHYDQGRVVFDLLLEVVPPGGGGEIQLDSLRQVLYAMDQRGFTFAKVTCDGFEGYSMRQELEKHGFDAEYVSVDRTREAYETWRDALREGKLDYYASEALQRNADALIDTGKKVDHTVDGGKDVADAMAAVTMVVLREHGGSALIGSVE